MNRPVNRQLRNWSVALLVVNIGVVLGGAVVRATGSGAGCGSHWPLCNGEALPSLVTVQRTIEFSHRMSTVCALALAIMVVWLAVRPHLDRVGGWMAALKRLRNRDARQSFLRANPEVGSLAAVLFFTLSEALIGAWLVLYKLVEKDQSITRSVSMGAHLTNTFLLIAALSLTIHYVSGNGRFSFRGQGGVAVWMVASLVGVIVVGATGAITALGDTLFPPASNSEIGRAVSSAAHFLVKLRIVHPFAAIGVGLLCVCAAVFAATVRPTDESRKWAIVVGVLLPVQMALGLYNLYMKVPLVLQLFHLLVADLFWIALVMLTASVLAVGAPRARFVWSIRSTNPGVLS